MMNREDAIEIINNTIPEKDAPIILDIIDKTIEIMSLEPLMSDEEFIALSIEERHKELVTSRICSLKFSDDLRCVFIRFVGNETPLAHAIFFPIEAVWSFLDTARNYFDTPGTTLTSDEIEEFSFNKAVNMFCIMIRNIYPRFMATMHSITDETINEWYRQENEHFRQYRASQGDFIPSNEPVVRKVRQNIIKDYGNEVKGVWEGEKKRFENYQKMRFAEEYEKLYEHWDTISLLYRSKKDFLGYAKRNGFEDTPDDLLEKLKGSHHRGMSLKALEHSARRIGLINSDNEDDEILEKRRTGINASGFSETTLFKYLEEGKKIIETQQSHRLAETTPPDVKQLTE
ncbi:MAG: hypothetical protein ACR2MD_01575 [Aridibacter sp.]